MYSWTVNIDRSIRQKYHPSNKRFMQTVWQDADSRNNTYPDHRPSNPNDRSKTFSLHRNTPWAAVIIDTVGSFPTSITFAKTPSIAQSVATGTTRPLVTTGTVPQAGSALTDFAVAGFASIREFRKGPWSLATSATTSRHFTWFYNGKRPSRRCPFWRILDNRSAAGCRPPLLPAL